LKTAATRQQHVFIARFLPAVQNNRYWNGINPGQTFEVSLHDQKIGMCRQFTCCQKYYVYNVQLVNCKCAISATLIVGPILFEITIFLRAEVRHFEHVL
jgi:hypothetical protein